MYTRNGRALDAYARLDVETGVMSASPQALVLMLFDGALKAIATARGEMQRHDPAAKGVAVSKAIGIIDDGLRASLDLSQGGEIARNLASLYEYMTLTLVRANARNDDALLEEVATLLRDLRSAWESMMKLQSDSAMPPANEAMVPPHRGAVLDGRV
ncbi:MAG: flagellar export chaperone FliS [Burkholderiales bacterium]|nr:flagellar export chaperone FliS [Burkholderiales bacterium]